MTALDQVLGLLLLALYIAAIVALAAGITYVVIKIFPTERKRKNGETPDKQDKPEKPKPAAADGSPGGGTLFRRSKRGQNS